MVNKDKGLGNNLNEIHDSKIPDCCVSCYHKDECQKKGITDICSHPFRICASFLRAEVYNIQRESNLHHG